MKLSKGNAMQPYNKIARYKRGFTAIIKPTHACNLRCRYCYVLDTAEQGTMNDTTLENAIVQVIEYNVQRGKASHFIWHGGEPLLMGTSFFEKVRSIQKRYDKGPGVLNSIQTNGTLIESSLLEFGLETGDFKISISIDGPPHYHDATRQCANGSGTFADIDRAIKLLRKYGYTTIGVISILTRSNIRDISGLYTFFKDNRLNVKVNPMFKAGGGQKNCEDLSITPEEYGNALIEFFDLWFYEKEYTITISPLSFIVGNIITRNPFGCYFRETCRDGFISIGPLGDVYPCGRFDGLAQFRLGNINTDTLEDIFVSDSYIKLRKRSAQTIAECVQCEFLDICNAGCMHNALISSNDILQKDNYCIAYKMIFQHIAAALHKEIKHADI